MCGATETGGAFMLGFMACAIICGCYVIVDGIRHSLEMKKRRISVVPSSSDEQ